MTDSICSVIIPVFNAEKTILSTLESVDLRGEHKYNIEVIVIDDGSTDGTKELVTDYAKTVKGISYYQKENGGVSSARNTGIKLVKSKYVFFLDADDTLLRGGLEAMIDTAQRNAVDLVITSFYKYSLSDKSKTKTECVLPRDTILNKDEIPEKILRRFFNGRNRGLPNLWNKLYVTDVIKTNSIHFDKLKTHGEDWHFNIEYLQRASSVYVTDNPVLIYKIAQVNYAKYKKRLAYSLIDEFRIAENLNRTYGFCTPKDEDYLLFIRRAMDKSIAYLSLKECSIKEKIHFLNSKEEKYLYSYLCRLNREELAFINCSGKDKIAFRLIRAKCFPLGIKILI